MIHGQQNVKFHYCTFPPTYANSTNVYMKPPLSATSQSLWNCINSNAIKVHSSRKGRSFYKSVTYVPKSSVQHTRSLQQNCALTVVSGGFLRIQRHKSDFPHLWQKCSN